MTEAHDDFDSPWKHIVEVYFAEFMDFFFPTAYADIDWSQPVEFLDKELQQAVRDAEFGRRHVDKLAKVWRKSGAEQWVLAHLEVQGQYEADFDERMYTYNYRLFDRYKRLVASFAVLSDDNPAWKPGNFAYELWGCTVSFQFPVAKLTDYADHWVALEASTNPFATVVMAHLKTQATHHDVEQRRFWKFYLIRHLYEQGYRRQAILNLFHFIDWIMRLPADLEQELWHDLQQLEIEKKMQYITNIERFAAERGREEGLQAGRQEEALRLLLRVLKHRFGEIPETVQAQLQALTIEQVEAVVDAALTSNSLAEFTAKLPPNPNYEQSK